MKFFPHKNSGQSQWSMDRSKGYEQLGSNKASKLLYDLCVQTPEVMIAVRLFGQGLVLVDCSARRGGSNDVILSCCQKTLASVSEPVNYLCKTKHFFLYCVSHPKKYSHLLNITIKYKVTDPFSLMF